MGWMIAGLVLGAFYTYVWLKVILPGSADERALRDYERQRAEFERWFE